MKSFLSWLAATLFFAYQYILRVAPNAIVDQTMQKFQISGAAIGQLAGSYYISYTLLHIPIGFALDRFGARKVISLACLCAVVGMLPLVLSDSFFFLICGRVLLGGASSVGVLGVFKVIRDSFLKEKFTLIFGASVFFALIAAMYGGLPIVYFIDNLGWNTTFAIILILGIFISIFAYTYIEDAQQKQKNAKIKQDLMQLFSLKKWLLISVIGGLDKNCSFDLSFKPQYHDKEENIEARAQSSKIIMLSKKKPS